MSSKSKKIIIGTIIFAIIVIIVILLMVFTKKENNEQETIPIVQLSELLEIRNLEDVKYKTEKTEEEISSKYVAETQKYKVKANVIVEETKGKMIYIRGVNNLNIYKTEYDIIKYSDKNTRINQIMQEFETICKNYMQGAEEYKETETIYGENEEQEGRLPVEESIYNKGRLYSKTYKNEENEYDINFYRKDKKIICEFVKILPFSNMYSKIRM